MQGSIAEGTAKAPSPWVGQKISGLRACGHYGAATQRQPAQRGPRNDVLVSVKTVA